MSQFFSKLTLYVAKKKKIQTFERLTFHLPLYLEKD